MERLKKILASALLVCMLVSMLPVGALAEDEVCAHSYAQTILAYPSCTVAGSASYTCSACRNTYNAEIPATGHNHQVTATTAPTCAAAGSTTYTCSLCGDSYTETISATGVHNFGAATCTAPKTCAVCGATDGAALGHSYSETVTKAATCTEVGVKTLTCSGCGDSYNAEISAPGHNFSDASCTAPKTCAVCGATDGAALGHSYSETVTKAATCTEDGEITYTCSRCLDSYTEIVTATGHSYENGVCGVCTAQCAHEGFMNATCTAPKTCAICHLTEGEPLGHTPGEETVITEATCIAEGSKSVKCTVCGETYTVVIPATGHTPGEETVVSEATCIAEGSKSVKCTVCGETYTAIIPATGTHIEGAHTVTKEATCEEAGEETISCAAEGCEYSETMEIPVLGHKYNEQHECSVCGEKEPLMKNAPSSNTFIITGDKIVHVGETITLSAVNGENNSVPVTWSSDSAAAIVEPSTGVVRGKSAGPAIIKATDGQTTLSVEVAVHEYGNYVYVDEHNHAQKCSTCGKISVQPGQHEYALNTEGCFGCTLCPYTMNKPEISSDSHPEGQPVLIGSTIQGLYVKNIPQDVSVLSNVTWTADPANAVTISHGWGTTVTTEKAADSVAITASYNGTPLDTWNLKIVENGKPAQTIKITGDEDTVYVGRNAIKLGYTLTPTDSTDQVLWSSSDDTIAFVDPSSGFVNGLKEGEVTITAKANDKKSDSKTIYVKVPVDSIHFDSKTIEVGETFKIVPQVSFVQPDMEPTDKTLRWSSNKPEVATVAADGTVIGLTSGTTTITATAADGQGAKGTATITVTPIKVKKIEVSGANEINVGDETTFSATVLPSTAGNKTVKWTSSDPTVATVNEDTGEVRGINKGHAVITATAQDGSNTNRSLQVYVIGSEAYEKAYIYAENHIVYVGETVKVHFVQPSDVEEITSASWSIAGASAGEGTIAGNLTEATVTGGSVVGTLDISVYVTGTKNDSSSYIGTITSARLITVKAADEKPEPVPVTGIAIEGSEKVLAGKSIPLTAKVTPEYADDTSVTWSIIDNPEVATVDENGVVTGIKAGTVTVKATAKDKSGAFATHNVTVEEIAVSIDGASTVLTGGTITLSAVVTPTDATDKTVTWTSSDDTIATVDENGVVTAGKKADEVVTITATSKADTTKSASKKITVTAPKLTVSGPGTVAVGKTITLTAKVSPDEVKDKTVTWTSSDETIATVDKDGKVTGKKVGDVKITATSNAYKNLTVEVPVKVTAAVYLYYGNGSHFNGIHPLPFVSSDLWAGGAGVSVVINGVPLVPGRDFSCYSSPSGMIGVTVHPGMLRLLSQNAWHTIDIVSANGVASGYFSTGYFGYYNINGVRTGDDSNPLLWAALCLLGISGAGMILVKSRKRKA